MVDQLVGSNPVAVVLCLLCSHAWDETAETAAKPQRKKHSLSFHWARLKIVSLVFRQQDSLQRLGQLLAISKAESAQKGDQIDHH